MCRRLFQIVLALGVAALLGPWPATAQAAPTELHFRLGQFVPRLALGQLDSVRSTRRPTPLPVVVARATVECPMPVAVPDLAKSERMPVARVDGAPGAMRQARMGCFNPLGPRPDSTAGRATPIP